MIIHGVTMQGDPSNGYYTGYYYIYYKPPSQIAGWAVVTWPDGSSAKVSFSTKYYYVY